MAMTSEHFQPGGMYYGMNSSLDRYNAEMAARRRAAQDYEDAQRQDGAGAVARPGDLGLGAAARHGEHGSGQQERNEREAAEALHLDPDSEGAPKFPPSVSRGARRDRRAAPR